MSCNQCCCPPIRGPIGPIGQQGPQGERGYLWINL